MADVARNKDKDGALEDQQWQVRRLRQTCALCHKHLEIHIYPNLYKRKNMVGSHLICTLKSAKNMLSYLQSYY